MYRVTEIHFNNNNLRGVIPASVARLTALRVFSIATTPSASPTTANVLFNPNCVVMPQCRDGTTVCITTNSGAKVCP